MKRAPFVIAATGAGLGLLLSFHTRPVHTTISSVGTAPAGSSSTSSSSTPSAGSSGPSNSSSPTTAKASGSSSSTSPPTTAPATRTATGQEVQYRYGDLELKVVEDGSKITSIDLVTDDATDPRSAEINSQAIPLLQQEAMSAQSANIDGVSGATFTSQAYADALQSALDKLGS